MKDRSETKQALSQELASLRQRNEELEKSEAARKKLEETLHESVRKYKELFERMSIGLAQYKPQEDMKAFVHRVDQLMYQGKKNGKDRVCSESY